MVKARNIQSVSEHGLCSGCGTCAYLTPDVIRIVDVPGEGRRPVVGEISRVGDNLDNAIEVCPGARLNHTFDRHDPGLIPELTDAWGPIYQLWEGYACDEEIRFAGSSGGAATALALFCIEKMGMHGTLHTSAREDIPYLNETVMSHTREELLGRTGSRYAPASPCEELSQIEDAPAPCVFIGKPCDVAATQKARKLRPALDEKLGLTIAFFCAGTPSTNGTLEMLKRMGVDDPSQLVSLRYRGKGWPGKAVAVFRRSDGTTETKELTYEESWGGLTKHVQWRCRVCADHTGEFADIAVGDPWYRTPKNGEAGSSLILARTKRGQEIIQAAIEAGYLVAEKCKPSRLPESQPNLLRTRGAVWGRIFACRLLGRPAPKYRGFPMFRFWLSELSVRQKLQSVGGTWKRLLRKRTNEGPATKDSSC